MDYYCFVISISVPAACQPESGGDSTLPVAYLGHEDDL
jgi:hypothetical protein